MRGGFLMGAIVGAAAMSYFYARRNNLNSMARMGTMVTSAIGDGFKMMTNTSNSANASSKEKSNSGAKNASSNHKSADSHEQLEQMIAKDASVQKEVNEIMQQTKH